MSKRSTKKRTPETTNNHVNFENSHDGQMLLNSISAAFYLARKENEYNGEFGIMKSLSRKTNADVKAQQIQEIMPVVKKKPAVESKETLESKIFTQLYRNTGYIRTTRPKN